MSKNHDTGHGIILSPFRLVTMKTAFGRVRTRSNAFTKIDKVPNGEPNFGSGSVSSPNPEPDLRPVQVQFGVQIGSEPDLANTSRGWVAC
jgi:hypothetical protein